VMISTRYRQGPTTAFPRSESWGGRRSRSTPIRDFAAGRSSSMPTPATSRARASTI
jgi:hypothetical protein